jgi:hypothetical protein
VKDVVVFDPYTFMVLHVRRDRVSQSAVERRNRDKDSRGMVLCKLPKQIAITYDQVILGDDGHRIAKLRQDFKAAAGELQTAFGGLICIGDIAHGNDLWPPTRRVQFFP